MIRLPTLTASRSDAGCGRWPIVRARPPRMATIASVGPAAGPPPHTETVEPRAAAPASWIACGRFNTVRGLPGAIRTSVASDASAASRPPAANTCDPRAAAAGSCTANGSLRDATSASRDGTVGRAAGATGVAGRAGARVTCGWPPQAATTTDTSTRASERLTPAKMAGGPEYNLAGARWITRLLRPRSPRPDADEQAADEEREQHRAGL